MNLIVYSDPIYLSLRLYSPSALATFPQNKANFKRKKKSNKTKNQDQTKAQKEATLVMEAVERPSEAQFTL